MRVVVTFLLISMVASPAFSQTEPAAGKPSLIAGTRIRLIPPAGFTPAFQFPGYQLESLGSSITVIEFPAPFSEVASTFNDAAALKTKGMSLINREEVKLQDRTGALVKVLQNQGGTDYVKHLLILGDDKEAVLIVATLPQSHEHELSEKMKASLLTASWESDKNLSPTQGLPFAFKELGNLKIADRMLNTIVLSRDGIFPSKDVNDPLFIIGQSINKVAPRDIEAFAKSRILQTTSVTEIELEQSNKVSIDNLSGYETIAKAKDTASSQPMVIYQAMLFEQENYYLMQGLISERHSQTYLPLFKEMARSFKRKNP